MIDVKDVFQAVVDKKPADYATGFDAVMKDKIAALVADRKLELATDLFGAPEGQEEQPEVTEPPDDDDETSEQEGDNDGEETDEDH